MASEVPSAIAGPLLGFENRPNLLANSETYSRPIDSEIFIAGMFNDSENALDSVTSPLNVLE